MPSVNLPLPFDAYQGEKPFVFVSYAHADGESAYRELASLHERGLRIWFDEGIDPGNEWPEEIANAIRRCSLFIALISPNAVSSRNVRNEINFAISENKEFLAIHMQQTELPPGLQLRIGDLQAVFRYNMDSEAYARKMRRSLSVQLIEQHSEEAPPNPPVARLSEPHKVEYGKPHFCLYCGDDPRFEVYPHPSFGSLSVSDGQLNFEPNSASIYFPDTGEKPTILSWPRSAIAAIVLTEHKVDFDHLYSEYGSEVEELSDDAGMRNFNVPLPLLRLSTIDPGGIITEGFQLMFAFGTTYRARSFGTKLARAFELAFDPVVK